jgi:acetyltransferase-like isoleucine patch superfamily enzyme
MSCNFCRRCGLCLALFGAAAITVEEGVAEPVILDPIGLVLQLQGATWVDTATPGQPAFQVIGNGVPVPECNGTFNGTFAGDVTVSAGQNCSFIAPCEIKGNVTINGSSFNTACAVDKNVTENSGGLVLGQGSSVGGNVQITGPSAFTLGPGVTIGANLEIQQVAASEPQETVCGIQVKRNLTAGNSASSVEIGGAPQSCAGNTIGGNPGRVRPHRRSLAAAGRTAPIAAGRYSARL